MLPVLAFVPAAPVPAVPGSPARAGILVNAVGRLTTRWSRPCTRRPALGGRRPAADQPGPFARELNGTALVTQAGAAASCGLATSCRAASPNLVTYFDSSGPGSGMLHVRGPRAACVGDAIMLDVYPISRFKQSSITLEVSPAAWLFVCAIKRRINNTRVFSVLTYRFLLIFQRFLTDCFPYVLFAFVKLKEISFRSKLV